MKLPEIIDRLETMRTFPVVNAFARVYRDALDEALEILRRLERKPLVVGPPMPVSLEEESA